jgi:hypothetical protein
MFSWTSRSCRHEEVQEVRGVLEGSQRRCSGDEEGQIRPLPKVRKHREGEAMIPFAYIWFLEAIFGRVRFFLHCWRLW